MRPESGTAMALAGMGAFQAALAAGAPWGNLSWGGIHRGVLPDSLRVVSGAAAVVYAGTACFVVSGAGSPRSRSRTFSAISLSLAVGTVVNAASPSRAERLVWTPACAATAALAWRSRR